MIIQRPFETNLLRETKKWVLVYGRRKTGKTFLVENFIKTNEYFFVKRDRTIISKNNKLLAYDTFLEILERGLKQNNTIVVDEFHRLPEDFLDFLQALEKKGKLILVSSTLHLAKKFFSSNSPLLGFFSEMPISLVRLSDVLNSLKNKIGDKKHLVESSILLREPMSIQEFSAKETAKESFRKILVSSSNTIPALVGEVFVEEERDISATYEGILRAVANRKGITGEISSYLYAARLIKKDDPSTIQQHLQNLIKFGVLKRIKVFDKNKYIYKHASPLAALFYYADEKYNVSERKMDVTSNELESIIEKFMPFLVEDNIREFLAEKLGLTPSLMLEKDFDVDVLLLKFKKPAVAAEIKWKNKITADDVRKAEETLEKTGAKRKILFVPNKKMVKQKTFLEVTDATDFI